MKKDFDTLEEFIKEFKLSDNALDMRDLYRWNGRSLSRQENLSEHTHLVVCCAIELFDFFNSIKKLNASFENVVKCALLHDSLEILRGDILSVTKDAIPNLREECDKEERYFMDKQINTTEIEREIVELADILSRFKFIERVLENPSNDFCLKLYDVLKIDYETRLENFMKKYDLRGSTPEKTQFIRLSKGHSTDTGVDIILNKQVILKPMTTTAIDLDVNIQIPPNCYGVICPRSSAAVKGIMISNCPIDQGYTGSVHAIVHNISNKIMIYDKGQSFAQIIVSPFVEQNSEIRYDTERYDGKFGSTGL